MSYKNKLLSLISENSVVFGGVEFNDTQSENTTVSEIQAAIGLYGLNFHQYEEGVLTAYTRKRSSVLAFTQFLDDNQYVEAYDISAKVYDGYGVVNDNTEIDFDIVPDSEFIEYYIDVIITTSQVEYAPVYVLPDEVEGDTSIDIPFEFIDTDNTSGMIPQSETPLLINVVGVDSHSIYGSFSVTVHPSDESKFLVQANYAEVPALKDVEVDLELINDYMHSDELEDSFTLLTPAEYKEGDLNTTSAIYQSKNKKEDVLNIVEAFKDNSIIYYSQELNEVKRIIKINFRGKRRIKMQCRKGYKYDASRKVCVKIAGDELAHSRIAHRQMARTKKASGEGYKRRIVRKANRAKRFRKLVGL